MPDLKLSPFVRPQSAVGSKHIVDSPQKSPDKTFRPWTTHSAQRRDFSPKRKVLRPTQNLRQSHLKTSSRKQVSAGGEKTTVVGFVSPPVVSSLDFPGEGGLELEVVTMVSTNKTAKESAEGPPGGREDGARREPAKSHPSFGTWVSGSPHDSDEYDTDLDDDDHLTESQSRKPSDASGLHVYEQQCKKHGLVPVSYLRRHLNKRSIRMRHHYLGGHAARTLAYAFRHNTITEIVDLSDNYIQSGGAVYMAAMLKDNNFLVSLNLSNNFIGSYGCEALAEMLDSNTTLKTLNLSGNQLTDSDMHQFIEPLKNNMSLSSLDLSHNNLGDMAGVHLAAALSVNDGISDLDLSWNYIRREGAVALVNSLEVNTVLEVLDVSWNGMGAEGATALQQCLQTNTSLRVLDLTNNRIDAKSGSRLAAGLKNNFGLETLMLNQNPLGDESIGAFLDAATVHPSLKFLSLENCGVSLPFVVHSC